MKLVYGIGINDADYKVTPVIDGKQISCPVYLKWKSMIQRCYDKSFHENHPSYIGCEVCESWLSFSGFKSWVGSRSVEGFELDKDLLLEGNKVYSPDTCILIPRWLNAFIKNAKKQRGEYLIGASFNKLKGKFVSQVSVNGKVTHLGCFDSEEDAHQAWKKSKLSQVVERKNDLDLIDIRIFDILIKQYNQEFL